MLPVQARILEWAAIFFSGDLPDPGIEPASPELAGGFISHEPPGTPSSVIHIYIYIRVYTHTHTHTHTHIHRHTHSFFYTFHDGLSQHMNVVP